VRIRGRGQLDIFSSKIPGGTEVNTKNLGVRVWLFYSEHAEYKEGALNLSCELGRLRVS
jgi:hypothetical protein